MLSAVKVEKHSKHMLMDTAVCSMDSPSCMYGICNSCPGIEPVKSVIKQFVGDKDQVIFRQSDTVDHPGQDTKCTLDFYGSDCTGTVRSGQTDNLNHRNRIRRFLSASGTFDFS